MRSSVFLYDSFSSPMRTGVPGDTFAIECPSYSLNERMKGLPCKVYCTGFT